MTPRHRALSAILIAGLIATTSMADAAAPLESGATSHRPVPLLARDTTLPGSSPTDPAWVRAIDEQVARRVDEGLVQATRIPSTDVLEDEGISWMFAARAGDVDGDGFEDLYSIEETSTSREFRIVALDGQTGAELSRQPIERASLSVPVSLTLPDSCSYAYFTWILVWEVTGDGVNDVVVISYTGDRHCDGDGYERMVRTVTVIPGDGAERWTETTEGWHLGGGPVADLRADWPSNVDVRGDGTSAEIMLATQAETPFEGRYTRVARVRASDGGLLSYASLPASEVYPSVRLGGDLDSDGATDLITRTSVDGGAVIRAHDARGAVSWEAEVRAAGYVFAWPRPVDGDGTDVLVYSEGARGELLRALDGGTGEQRWVTRLPEDGSLDLVTDRDDDGWLDFVVVRPGDGETEVTVRSSASGAVLTVHRYPALGAFLWSYLWDITGDGIDDLYVEGLPAGYLFCPGSPGEIRSMLIDGASMALHWTADSLPCGGEWPVGGDVDGDGSDDLGSVDDDAGVVRVVSGATHETIVKFPSNGGGYGYVLAADLTDTAGLELVVEESSPASLTASTGSGAPIWRRPPNP